MKDLFDGVGVAKPTNTKEGWDDKFHSEGVGLV